MMKQNKIKNLIDKYPLAFIIGLIVVTGLFVIIVNSYDRVEPVYEPLTSEENEYILRYIDNLEFFSSTTLIISKTMKRTSNYELSIGQCTTILRESNINYNLIT